MKSKDLCVGCRNDFYNAKNDLGIKECLHYASARVVKRFRIGWWTQPTTVDAFTEVTTFDCHNAPGQYALYERLPDHLVRLTHSGGVGADNPEQETG